MSHHRSRLQTLCKALSILSQKADTLSIPMKTDFYDVIVDAKNVLSRVKVLRTNSKSRCGSYVVALRKGMSKSKFSNISCEFVFVESPEGMYLIPSNEILQTTAITLSRFNEYKIKLP